MSATLGLTSNYENNPAPRLGQDKPKTNPIGAYFDDKIGKIKAPCRTQGALQSLRLKTQAGQLLSPAAIRRPADRNRGS